VKEQGDNFSFPIELCIQFMTLAGNQPILKIYPDAGHLIHADNPGRVRRRCRGFHPWFGGIRTS